MATDRDLSPAEQLHFLPELLSKSPLSLGPAAFALSMQ
jgi:hypothetical protein